MDAVTERMLLVVFKEHKTEQMHRLR